MEDPVPAESPKIPPIQADLASVNELDDKVIPLEAARAHLRHWWREPVAGLLAVAIGTFDAWHFDGDAGLPASLDQILILGGIVLIAGSKRLFSPAPIGPQK